MSKLLKQSTSSNDVAYRVLFIVDATGSMGTFLNSLIISLYQIGSIMKLATEKKSEIGVLWYRDYDQPANKVTGFSGYSNDMRKISEFLSTLKPDGGGDEPEATKTALNKALDMNLVDSKTIVFIYTDAPPHHSTTGGSSRKKEEQVIKEKDWIQLCKLYQQTGCRIFSFINQSRFETASFYILLSAYTQSKAFFLRLTNVETISKCTINLFLSLCNAEYEPTDLVQCLEFLNTAHDSTHQNSSRKYKSKERPLRESSWRCDPCNIDLSAFHNENDACCQNHSYLPGQKSPRATINTVSFNVEPIEFMIVDLRFMMTKFDNDDKYKSDVYEIFKSLMVPQHIVALTYNSILGLLWRSICSKRKDVRRDELVGMLSQTLNTMTTNANALSKATAEIVRSWVEESYNSKETILAAMCEVKEQVPALVLTLNGKMSRTELMEITRSCSPQTIRNVMSLLNHLTVVTYFGNLPENYLPLNMNDCNLFQFLPHLLAEGLTFSLRPAAIIAMLCILSKNSILEKRAADFLTSIKGKWIDLEQTENYSYSLSKICVQLKEFFTEDEQSFFKKLYIIGGIKINAATRITIEQPFTPTANTIRHDTKILCRTCNILRSTTLYPDVSTSCCALCLPQNDMQNVPEPCSGEMSHLVQCGKCSCLYAIVQYDKLYASPKCYYCRDLGRETPYRCCTGCQNKYVHYDSTATKSGEEYTFLCAECQHSENKQAISTREVSMSTLINENKAILFKYLNINVKKDDIDIFSREWSLFKLRDKVELLRTKNVNSIRQSTSSVVLTYKNKLIFQLDTVFHQIRSWIRSGKSEMVTCYICCDDVPRDKMNDTCGNKLCHAEACTDCLTKWYEVVQPGSIVLIAHLSCPFCKHAPNGKILKRYNKQACTIVRSDKKNDYDEHWYYGWCLNCYKVKMAQEKVCLADGEIPQLHDFVCDECEAKRKQKSTPTDVKYCPGINQTTKQTCGIAVSKNGGCNHITCTACNSHWCWLCVKTYERIYEHLTAAHGNFGFEIGANADYENDYWD
ncbi:unnamed protein product [Rotaria socialis]|uniref:Uncharacterized protein n=1 Tax=Rotaria socialis TaxID=392032 RepID=A0A818VRB9_9BILA|nr:unnamed protein product [Rotaria socialis]CAF4453010.1 unnamed protein product [Rotaria socialis]